MRKNWHSQTKMFIKCAKTCTHKPDLLPSLVLYFFLCAVAFFFLFLSSKYRASYTLCFCLHTTRSAYRKLGVLKRLSPRTPVLALTATATDMVVKDIIKSLGLANTNIVRTTFDRPNLFLEVSIKVSIPVHGFKSYPQLFYLVFSLYFLLEVVLWFVYTIVKSICGQSVGGSVSSWLVSAARRRSLVRRFKKPGEGYKLSKSRNRFLFYNFYTELFIFFS